MWLKNIKKGSIQALAREAIAQTGLLPVVVSFLLALCAAVVARFAEQPLLIRAVIGLVVFVGFLFAVALVKYIRTKPKAEETEASEDLVEAVINTTPDIDMTEAIDYVVAFLFPDSDPNHLDYTIEIPAAAKLITEKLRSGELVAWGKRIESAPDGFNLGGTTWKTHTTDNDIFFRKEEWEYRELIPLSASIPREDRPQTQSFGSKVDHIQLTGLRVNSKKVEELWPFPKGIEYEFMSRVARIAFDKHKDPDIPEYNLAFVDFLEGFNEASNLRNVDLLSNIAKAIAYYVDIYGVHESGNTQIRIDRNKLKLDGGKYFFHNNGNSIYKKQGSSFMPEPNIHVWGNICIKQDDIEHVLEDIKKFEDNS